PVVGPNSLPQPFLSPPRFRAGPHQVPLRHVHPTPTPSPAAHSSPTPSCFLACCSHSLPLNLAHHVPISPPPAPRFPFPAASLCSLSALSVTRLVRTRWECGGREPALFHFSAFFLPCSFSSQLPYLIDGNTKLTQSNAILRYIARKHNLCGETEEERVRVDMLESQAMDFRMQLVRVCYSPDFEKLRPGYLEQLPVQMKLFSQFLGKRKWFAGDKLTFADFLLYDVLDQNRMFEPKCLDEFSNLSEFLARFEALEKIAAYMRSDRFIKLPINNKMAKWGNKKA
uniref:Glutathione S-transferase n=1 Tax=Ornithorhynchus anatinus TaxID=9258 RepID=A0A6I8MYR8_ORNAN